MTIITIDRAVVEQALEALKSVQPQNMGPLIYPAITALRAALAQQAEPHRDLRAALQAPGCERLREWVEIGPVQRAALETFAAALAQQAEPVPMPPFPPVSQWNRGCAVCGAHGNATGYVCPRFDCPTKVTCGGVA